MRPRTLALGLTLLLGLALLLAWWGSSPPVANLGPREGPIVILGDSLAAGVGSASKQGFVGRLEQRLGISIVNKGISGNTTRQGLDRLERDVLSLKPALVIVELGGNDFLQKVPPDETFANLEQIIARIQAQGAPVLLLGVQGGLFQDKAGGRYQSLARKMKTAYVANIMDGIWTNPALKDDTIHPNDAGYERVAERIEPTLRRMLQAMQR